MSLLQLALSSSKEHCRALLSINKFAISRHLTSSLPKENKSATKSTNEWKSFYRFPQIQTLVSANRLKYYQALITAIGVPISFGLSEFIDPAVVAWVGISGTITLSLVSYAFRNTVGFIYTNDKRPDMVKIAYMDFWGRRIDSEMNIDDVVPFSELPKTLLDSYVTTLRFHHDHPKLKLIYKFGGVNDMNEFAKVFGIER